MKNWLHLVLIGSQGFYEISTIVILSYILCKVFYKLKQIAQVDNKDRGGKEKKKIHRTRWMLDERMNKRHLISILKGNRDWNDAYQNLTLRLYAKAARISRLVIWGWKVCKWLFLNEHINIAKFCKKCLNFNLTFESTDISKMLFPLINGYILI